MRPSLSPAHINYPEAVMGDRWYYQRGDTRNGPFTALEMKDMAGSGHIRGTDSVSRDGVTARILASQIKNLFPPIRALDGVPVVQIAVAAAPFAAVLEPDMFIELDPSDALLRSLTPPITVAPVETKIVEKAPAKPVPEKKKRAIAGKGCVIVGQDGNIVRYKKKCVTCGHEDSFSNTHKIVNGLMKSYFFCPKCKKRRDVEVQGRIG